ncbi:MAG: hypothetical protein M1482_14630 [Chloroflexi bacterium]|nr:hypothetical protein [Chloroflexota bacterium]
MFLGIDWTHVNWIDVASLLGLSTALTVVVLGAIRLLPIVPTARKKLFYLFAVLIIWAPVGLITPGVAYGEWVPEQGFDKLPGAGYLPQGVDQLSRLWKAPFQFYQLPWVSQTAPVSQQAPGYIVSAALGVGIVVGVTWLLGKWLARREGSDAKVND